MPDTTTASDKPNILHKYRTDNVYTEQIISDQRVFLATAEQLNDPFECTLQDISKEWVVDQVLAGMQSALAGLVMSVQDTKRRKERFFGLSPSKAEKALAKIMSAGSVQESYDAMREFVRKRTGHPPTDCRTIFVRMDDQLIRTGIFSMSARPDQPLMWAHYGGDHYGVCLGFEAVKSSKLSDPSHCLPVSYSDELPEMDKRGLKVVLVMKTGRRGIYTEQDVAFDDLTFQRVVSTKPTDWHYEQEYRYIEKNGGLHPWPGRLAELTFGLRCTDDRRRYYIDLIEEHVPNDVRLFEMRKVRGTNGLERVPLTPCVVHGRGPDRQFDVEPDETSSSKNLNQEAFAAKMQELLLAGDYHEIIFQTGENLMSNQAEPMLHALKAQAHGFAREHTQALFHFKRLSELLPDAADAWYGMGVALTQMGRPAEAIAPLRRAYMINPNDASHALNLGSLLVEQEGSLDEGLACLRQADRLGHRRAGRIIREVESEKWQPTTSAGEALRGSE